MKNQVNSFPLDHLPLRRDLTPAFAFSILTAFLMTAASLGGLIFPSIIYPTDELRQSYLANDLVNLLVGLPILLSSMWLTRHGKLIGLLCWPGALLYTFYNYIAYIFGIPLSLFTLVFAALVLLSAYPVFDLLRSMDQDRIKTQLAGTVSERFSGGVLVFFGAGFFFLAVGVITGASTGQTISKPDVGVAVADITLSLLLLIGGIMLFQRKPLGYSSGMGLLFAASMLFIGVILVVLFQPLLTDTPFVLEDVIVLSGMTLICFIPTAFFIRGILSKGKT